MKFVSMLVSDAGVKHDVTLESCVFDCIDGLIRYTKGSGHHYVDRRAVERTLGSSGGAVPVLSRDNDERLVVNGIVISNEDLTNPVILTLSHKGLELQSLQIPADVLSCCVMQRQPECAKLFLGNDIANCIIDFSSCMSGEKVRFTLIKDGYQIDLVKIRLSKDCEVIA